MIGTIKLSSMVRAIKLFEIFEYKLYPVKEI